MRARSRYRPAVLAGFVAIAALVLAVPAARASGVSVAMQPSPKSVEPDSTFSLDLAVTAAGAAFNGFEAVIGYDPAVLTFVPASPLSQQEGCLMTGGCSSACGTVYHHFAAAGDSLVIDLSLLCDSLAITGPGQLYTLSFRAGASEATTYVRVRRIRVYDAGVLVTPVTSADAQVSIHRTSGVLPLAPGAGLRLAASPNPAVGALALAIRSDHAGEQRVELLDPAGRLVRVLDASWQLPGTRLVRWDGAGAGGARLPAGVYLARVRMGGAMAQARVVLLR